MNINFIIKSTEFMRSHELKHIPRYNEKITFSDDNYIYRVTDIEHFVDDSNKFNVYLEKFGNKVEEFKND